MCGIFGITAKTDNSVPILIKSLEHLTYRGYDSSGVCLALEKLTVFKTLGNTENLTPLFESLSATTCIGHTRWATHGKITLKNAHPHMSEETVSIVHNGIIENHETLRANLIVKGYRFCSETDSEVIAHLLHHHLKTRSPLEAMAKLEQQLVGRYAFIALIQAQPNEVFGLTNNLPLLVGKGKNSLSIASDLAALRHCQQFTRIPSNIPFSINATHFSLPANFEDMPYIAPENTSLSQHKTHQEILSQVDLPKRIIDHWDHEKIAALPRPKHIVFIACGSSYHCAAIAKHWFNQLGIFVTLDFASELRETAVPFLEDAWLVAISQSGETADTLLCLQSLAKSPHLHSIAITNTPASSIAHLCQTVISTQAQLEQGVASTKAVTAQILSLFLLCQSLAKSPQSLPVNVLKNSVHALFLNKSIGSVAKQLANHQQIIFLAKGALFPVAQEFALKIKELAYIHAEAIPLGELKHGPLALVDKTKLCVILGDGNATSIKTAVSEIQARRGKVLLIGPNAPIDKGVSIPTIGSLDLVLLNITCQLLSYFCAKHLKHPIDQPRNLAKSVTVE